MSNFDQFALACRMFGGEAIYDDRGYPSVYVPFKSIQLKNLIKTSSEAVHPAFIVNGRQIEEIYIGKYHGMMHDGRMYSLPLEPPGHSFNWDTARANCAAKGPGHHMMTLAEFALVALMCKRAKNYPLGNNNYGKDASETVYTGIPCTYETDGKTQHILEGTGPLSYYHDGTINGLWGMNGNVWQWIAGYRTMNGEIQIIPDNNAAANVDQGVNSTLWRAIKPDGQLVVPGSPDTLHWNWKDGKITLDTVSDNTETDEWHSTAFKDLAIATEHVGESAPDILKALALFPDGEDELNYGGDGRWMNMKGERMALVGGPYYNGGGAGVFALHGSTRGDVLVRVGSRPAFCKL